MIVFVYDLAGLTDREHYRAALDALVDPVMKYLPGSAKADAPIPGAVNVSYFVRPGGPLYDVFISHGIADKRWRDYPGVRDYPHIFHSGPRWKAKYTTEGAPPAQLHQVGYAKLDPLFDGTYRRGRRGRILWAPTHHRGWPDHYDLAAAAVRALPLPIAESVHPVKGGTSTLQALLDADVVIADGGSTIYEAWALGKPVVFPTWLVMKSTLIRPETFEQEIYERRIGWHAESEADLGRQVELARDHGITTAEREFIEGIFPTDLRGRSGLAHADALRAIEASKE